MKRLPDWIARRLLCLAGALLLAACGPGTGGTGTGPGAANGLAEGTYGTVEQPAQPVALTVSDDRVELNLPCRRFVYEGRWSFDAQGQAELFGRWQALVVSGASTVLQEQSARLTLQIGLAGLTGGAASGMELTVTNPAGTALVQPVILAQQAQNTPPISCLLSYTFQ